MIVRELSGGLDDGRKGRTTDGMAFDICEYYPWQIERIARRAFEPPAADGGTSPW